LDWFETLTGFRESEAAIRRHLSVVEGRLVSSANGRSFAVGELSLPSLDELRSTAASASSGRLVVHNVHGDVGALHRDRSMAGALFQVASQFNLLEMIGPGVTPEDGVTRYAQDRTQGPVCAMAAGAATIFRNWFVPVKGGLGQARDRQLDALFRMGEALSRCLSIPVSRLWRMQNGYALCTSAGLAAIGEYLRAASEDDKDTLRGTLRIGLHRDVEVTDGEYPLQRVSQAFCSALPVAYGDSPAAEWEAFARLVLEAAYEATLCAAVVNARHTGCRIVVLTFLGGGAFGNGERWIGEAMRRALRLMKGHALEVRILSYGKPPGFALELEKEFSR
jgi:hypothetical protein